MKRERNVEPPVQGQRDRLVLKAFVVPSLLISFVALMMTEAARLAFTGREDQTRISLRLFMEDHRLAWTAILVLGAGPLATRLYPTAEKVLTAFQRRPVAVAIALVAVLLGGASLVLLRHPLSADEAAAVFQARVFAAGATAGSIPPPLLEYAIPAEYHGFFYDVDRTTGRVASNYWPVYALLLTPFAALGVPFALNPLLGGLSIIALHRLAARLFPATDAPGLCILFALASPAFMFNAMSFFAMPAHLLANTIWVLLVLTPTSRRLILAGVLGGLALLLHSPFPHALFAFPWLLWLVLRKGGFRRATLLAAGYLPVLLILGGWWMWVHSGIQGMDVSAGPGFGQATNENPIESIRYAFHLPDAVVLWVRATEAVKVVLWSAPGLVAISLLGFKVQRERVEIRLLAASASCLLLGYLLVFFDQGAGWSSRYFHPGWFALPLLAAGALVRKTEPGLAAVRKVGVTVALICIPLANGVAAIGAHRVINAHLSQRPPVHAGRRQVIVMNATAGYYVRDLIHNDPFLRGPVVYLLAHEPAQIDSTIRRVFPAARPAAEDSVAVRWWIDGPMSTDMSSGCESTDVARKWRIPAAQRTRCNSTAVESWYMTDQLVSR